MSGKATPLAANVIKELKHALKLGDSLAPIRSKCVSVPKRTWHNWIKKAKAELEAEEPSTPKKPKRFRDITPADIGGESPADATPDPTIARRRRPKPEPPPVDDPAVTPPAPEPGMGLAGLEFPDDPIPGNGTTRRLRDPDDARGNVVDITGELNKTLGLADALIDCSVKKIGDSHIIVDPMSYAEGLKIRLKTIDNLFRTYERVSNADQLNAFCKSVLTRVSQSDPATAKQIVQDMRQFLGSINPRLWQSQA